MDAEGETVGVDGPDDAERPGPRSPRVPPALTTVLGALVLSVLAFLAVQVRLEVTDRRSEGFCRPDHAIPGAVGSEERTWWPLGERCRLDLADGSTRVREPGWWLTALVAAWGVTVAAGAVAPRRSARRRVAWIAVVPAVPVAVLVAVTVQPRSLARLVSLTTVSVGFGALMGAVTAAVVWAVARGRVLATVLGSWLAWAVIVFAQGRDSIGP